jgi:hypothetical protein
MFCHRMSCGLIASDFLLGGTYPDDTNDLVGEAQAGETVDINTSGGGIVDGGNDVLDEGLGAHGIVAGIFRVRLSIART